MREKLMERMFRTLFSGKRKAQSTESREAKSSEEKAPWSKFDDLPLNEKRKLYRCGKDYVTVNTIQTWPQYRQENLYPIYGRKGKRPEKPIFEVKETLNEKISLWQGDITTLEIDAIVNAANSSLLGGGGVDGCIHHAAGQTLRQECAGLDGCSTGDAKISSGHKLPAKYIIHTVGPIGQKEKFLKSCYRRCLELVKKHGLRTVAFCCISTGIFGYPIYDATCVALETVREWLQHEDDEGKKNADLVDRIIFCVFLAGDLDVYKLLLPRYFPSADKYDNGDDLESSDQQGDKKGDNDDEGENVEKGKVKTDTHPPKKGDGGEEIDHSENPESTGQQDKTKEEEDVVKEKDKEDVRQTEGEKGEEAIKGKNTTEEEAEDIEIDEEAIKEGVPDPPKLEELLEPQEEEGTKVDVEMVNKDLPSDELKTKMEEKECDSTKEQSGMEPSGTVQLKEEID